MFIRRIHFTSSAYENGNLLYYRIPLAKSTVFQKIFFLCKAPENQHIPPSSYKIIISNGHSTQKNSHFIISFNRNLFTLYTLCFYNDIKDEYLVILKCPFIQI